MILIPNQCLKVNGRVPEARWLPKQVDLHSARRIGLLGFSFISKVKEPQYAFTFDNVLHFHSCSQSVYLETMLSNHSNGVPATFA